MIGTITTPMMPYLVAVKGKIIIIIQILFELDYLFTPSPGSHDLKEGSRPIKNGQAMADLF